MSQNLLKFVGLTSVGVGIYYGLKNSNVIAGRQQVKVDAQNVRKQEEQKKQKDYVLGLERQIRVLEGKEQPSAHGEKKPKKDADEFDEFLEMGGLGDDE